MQKKFAFTNKKNIMLLTNVAKIWLCNIFYMCKYNFMDFIKNSFRELKHVVWPTREETKKYFLVVISVLVLFGIYLFIASTIFSEILYYLKNLV